VAEPSLVVVVSGPGGVGKGTVVEQIVRADPRLWLSRSWTTRARRPGEAADAYRFATRDQFEERIAAGGFLEWAEFLGELYGTPLPEAPEGRDVLLEIDVQGARQVRERVADPLLIFLDAPSEDEQAQRLRRRGDPEEKVLDRLATASRERAEGEALGAVRVVNDELDATVARLLAIIEETRRSRSAKPPW
jgi:guanylate kinase